jgi:hypothetical protein
MIWIGNNQRRTSLIVPFLGLTFPQINGGLNRFIGLGHPHLLTVLDNKWVNRSKIVN